MADEVDKKLEDQERLGSDPVVDSYFALADGLRNRARSLGPNSPEPTPAASPNTLGEPNVPVPPAAAEPIPDEPELEPSISIKPPDFEPPAYNPNVYSPAPLAWPQERNPLSTFIDKARTRAAQAKRFLRSNGKLGKVAGKVREAFEERGEGVELPIAEKPENQWQGTSMYEAPGERAARVVKEERERVQFVAETKRKAAETKAAIDKAFNERGEGIELSVEPPEDKRWKSTSMVEDPADREARLEKEKEVREEKAQKKQEEKEIVESWRTAREDFKRADELDGAPDISSNLLRRGGQEPEGYGRDPLSPPNESRGWRDFFGKSEREKAFLDYKNGLVAEFEENPDFRQLSDIARFVASEGVLDWGDGYYAGTLDILAAARGTRFFTELHEQYYQELNNSRLYSLYEGRHTNFTSDAFDDVSDRMKLFSADYFKEEMDKRVKNVKGWGPSFLWPITAVGERNRQVKLLNDQKNFTNRDDYELALLEAAENREIIEKRGPRFGPNSPGILSPEERTILLHLRTLKRLNTAEGHDALRNMTRGLDIYRNDPALHREDALVDKLRLANRSKGWDNEAQRTLLAIESASLARQFGIENIPIVPGEGNLEARLIQLQADNSGGLRTLRNWIRIAQDNSREEKRIAALEEFRQRDSDPQADQRAEELALTNKDHLEGTKRFKKMSWGADEKALLAELEAGRDDLVVRGTEESEKKLKAFDDRYGELLGALKTLKRRNTGMWRTIGLYHRIEDSLSNKKRTEIARVEAQRRAEARRVAAENEASQASVQGVQGLETTVAQATAQANESAAKRQRDAEDAAFKKQVEDARAKATRLRNEATAARQKADLAKQQGSGTPNSTP